MENLRGLLGIRRIEKIPNVLIRELYGAKKGWIKGLMKMFFGGLVTLEGWRIVEMPKECRRGVYVNSFSGSTTKKVDSFS